MLLTEFLIDKKVQDLKDCEIKLLVLKIGKGEGFKERAVQLPFTKAGKTIRGEGNPDFCLGFSH